MSGRVAECRTVALLENDLAAGFQTKPTATALLEAHVGTALFQSLAKLPDGDLKAIFAYLRSIPPIHNGVPGLKVPDAVLDQIAASYDKILHAQR